MCCKDGGEAGKNRNGYREANGIATAERSKRVRGVVYEGGERSTHDEKSIPIELGTCESFRD
jgi:hypothetical protein